MIKVFRRAWREIGGRDFGNPASYVPVLPIALVGGVQIGQNTIVPQVAIGYLLANAVGLAICALIGLFVWLTRRDSGKVLPFTAVFLFCLLIGTVKAASTGVIVNFAGLEEDLISAITERVPGATIASIVTILMISFLAGLRRLFVENRYLLVAARVSKKQRDFAKQKIAELAEFVDQVMEKVKESANSTEAAKLLTELLEMKVKPLSRELWLDEERRLKGFETKELIRRALFSEPFPALALTLILIAITPDALGIMRELDISTLSFAIQMFTVFAGFQSLNLVKRILNRSAVIPLFLLITLSVSYLVSFFIPQWILNSVEANAIYSFLFLLIFIPNIGLIGASILYLLRNGMSQLEQIKIENQDLSEASQQELESVLIGRKVAGALHGNVQNRILSSLEAIRTGKDLREELISIQESVNQLNQTLVEPEEIMLSALLKAWSSLLNIDYGPDRQLTGVQARVLDEAISNAYRHGKAMNLSIKISPDGRLLEITDDGFGPVAGKRGLGSYIFSSAGNWKLESSGDGGSKFSISFYS